MAAIAWQATVNAIVGIVFGIPIGIMAGRELWTLFVRNINAVPDPTIPVVAVVLVAIGTLHVEIHSDDATITAETQPYPFLGFPTGVPGETLNVLDLCLQGLLMVRAIIAALTEIQWGSPMALPETPSDFVTPLAIEIAKLYGP